jgi:hypothetical protein
MDTQAKLIKLEGMAKDLIKYYCPEYTFTWDRSTRRKGQCRYGVKQIGISKPLAELNDIECMLLTITHEIAHALTKGEHHNQTWKNKCLEIGGDGRTYYDASSTVRPKQWILYKNGVPTSIKRFRRFRLNEFRNDLEWRKE